MKISAADLKAKGACLDQAALFRKTFGARPINITAALCAKHAQKFHWDWAACVVVGNSPLKKCPINRSYFDRQGIGGAKLTAPPPVGQVGWPLVRKLEASASTPKVHSYLRCPSKDV